jgi:lysophospholipase L1-like esterase
VRSRFLELRLGWLLLGCATAVAFFVPLPDRPFAYLVLVGGPWLLGTAMLASTSRCVTITRRWSEAIAARSSRVSLVVLGGLLLLLTDVFGVAAGMLALISTGFLGFVACGVASSKKLVRWVEGLAMAAVMTAVLLGAAEAVLRRPAIAGRLGLTSELRAWHDRYDRLWDHNLFGLRSPYETVARHAGVCRVVTLGDSFTWGGGVAETKDTWPARLEALLNREYAPARCQVINMAEAGYTTANEAEKLRRLGWQFNPDIVVVQYFENDPLPSGPDFERVGDVTPAPHILPARLREGLVDRSDLLSLVDKAWGQIKSHGFPRKPIHALYRPGSKGWRQVKAAFREMADSAHARKVPILLVIFPYLQPGTWTQSTYPDRDINAQVRTAAEAAGLPVLDLTKTFADQGKDGRHWWATPYDPHPGSAAHALAARRIAQEIESRGWLPDAMTGR